MMVSVPRLLTASPTAGAAGRSAAARRALRTLAVLVAVAVGLLAGAGAAQAHATLVSTDPADGSTVAVVPTQVTLTFDEPVRSLGTQVVVLAPDGRTVSSGDAVLADTSVSEALTSGLPAGAYTVEWRVTSADGHPLSGKLVFTAAAGTAPAGSTAPTDPATVLPAPTDRSTFTVVAPVDSDADTGLAPGMVAGVAAIVIALAVIGPILLLRRRHSDAGGR
jgi:methionine-rich copper-binding protein CopC